MVLFEDNFIIYSFNYYRLINGRRLLYQDYNLTSYDYNKAGCDNYNGTGRDNYNQASRDNYNEAGRYNHDGNHPGNQEGRHS